MRWFVANNYHHYTPHELEEAEPKRFEKMAQLVVDPKDVLDLISRADWDDRAKKELHELHDRLAAAYGEELKALCQGPDGPALLCVTCTYGYEREEDVGLPLLRLFVEQGDADPEARYLDFYDEKLETCPTPLMTAANHLSIHCARYLLEQVRVNASAQDGKGATALHYLVAGPPDHPELLELLLKHHADPNLLDNDGNSALICLAEEDSCFHPDRSKMAELLIQYGAEVHVTNKKGETALHISAVCGCTKFLLAHGANIEARDANGKTPLDANNESDGMGRVVNCLREGDVRRLDAVLDVLLQHYSGLVFQQRGDLCLHWLL